MIVSWLSKTLKKIKKAVKPVTNLNPLIPGSKASKSVSQAAKVGLGAIAPQVASGLTTNFISGATPGSNSTIGNILGDVQGTINKAGTFADGLAAAFGAFSGSSGAPSVSGPMAPPPVQEMTAGNGRGAGGLSTQTLLLIGGGAIVLLLLTRKR